MLKEEARKTFFTNYEAAMSRQFAPAKGEPHTDFRRVIDASVAAVLRAMEGERDIEFFVMP